MSHKHDCCCNCGCNSRCNSACNYNCNRQPYGYGGYGNSCGFNNCSSYGCNSGCGGSLIILLLLLGVCC